MEESGKGDEMSVFQIKFNEFVEDLFGALPEYTQQIQGAKDLSEKARIERFQEEVKVGNTLGGGDDFNKNPGRILPGVEIADSVWSTLSDNTKKAIWEHVRIVSICCFMEAGFGSGLGEGEGQGEDGDKPIWMEEAMKDMKQKLESADFQNIIKKFMTFFKPTGTEGTETSGETGATDATGGSGAADTTMPPGLEGIFANGFPKIPEKFMKGHIARLAQEIVKEITPEDLGISKEMIAECEKNPAKAFDILFSVVGNNPGVLQKTIQKIGKRLQQKVMSGSIRPQEIAHEAEELMKEFAGNSSFVEMMGGLKSAFGFEDMDLARQTGREGSARLSLVKDRLRKKASEKEAKKAGTSTLVSTAAAVAESDAIAAMLIQEESVKPKNEIKKKSGKGGKK